MESKFTRFFKAWEEEWEQDAIQKKSPVNEAKLLNKYGGLSWYDLDNEKMVYSGQSDLKWFRITRDRQGEIKNGGYALLSYDEHYDKEKEDKEDHTEPSTFSENLGYCIADY